MGFFQAEHRAACAAMPSRPSPSLGPLAARAAVLFLVLCAAKLALLFTFREHLFEIQWRVDIEHVDWVNPVAFYMLAALAGLSVWSLETRVPAGDTRAIRAVNGAVLALGALLILLTFPESDPRFLQPPWTDPHWYASLRVFLQPPYWGAWIVVYILVYRWLVRTEREHLVFRVTGAFAAAGVAFGLRGALDSREVLVTADAMGIACLLGGHRATRPLDLRWLLLPAGWTVLLFYLFHSYTSLLRLHGVAPVCVLLIAVAVVAFVCATVWSWRRGAFAAWSWLLPFAFTTFALITNSVFGWQHLFYNALCDGLTVPRYFLGELTVSAALFGLGWVYRRWRPGGSLGWLDAICLVLIFLTLCDARLAQVMGMRMDWRVLALAFGESPKMVWRLARPYLPGVVVALLAIGAMYAGLIRCMGWGPRVHSGAAGRHGPALRFLVAAVVLLGFAGHALMIPDEVEAQTLASLATTSPFWRHMTTPLMDTASFERAARGLGWTWGAGAPPAGSRLDASSRAFGDNVVLIFQESSYNKYLSLFDGKEDTEPLLSKYKDRMEVFPNFFSDFAGSINARFAAFDGLYPVDDYNAFTTHRVPVKDAFEVLHGRGYDTSLFYSSYFDYTNFIGMLRGRGIGRMFDADNMPGHGEGKGVAWGIREETTLNAIRDQIKEYAAGGRKFFLTYVPAAPHNPFDGTPAAFKKYPPGKQGDLTGPYLNELLYMDWVISSIVDQLRDSGLLDRTVVVITDDHGEMLGAHGGPVGHGWALNPVLANIPLIIMNPHRPGYRVNDAIGSQVDLLPTLLDVLGIPLPTDQLYQGASLYAPAASRPRKIYLNTFEQFGIIVGDTFICGDRDVAPGEADAHSPESNYPGAIFSITNQGARTVFKSVDRRPPGLTDDDFSITAFDAFQSNFLKNYGDYRARMYPTAP